MLILFAHPALQRSRVHRQLARAVRDLDGVTFHDLYEEYPDFDIDVAREQELLVSHSALVLQHPFYWYSAPAIVKQWIDLVLEHGWAYGPGGTALREKMLMSAISTGGRESTYRREGLNRFTIRELLAPIEQTIALCGVEYLPPFVVHGAHEMTDPEISRVAGDYRRCVVALRDGGLDLEATRGRARLNEDLDAVLAEVTPR